MVALKVLIYFNLGGKKSFPPKPLDKVCRIDFKFFVCHVENLTRHCTACNQNFTIFNKLKLTMTSMLTFWGHDNYLPTLDQGSSQGTQEKINKFIFYFLNILFMFYACISLQNMQKCMAIHFCFPFIEGKFSCF
jgi:hypothetical protein